MWAPPIYSATTLDFFTLSPMDSGNTHEMEYVTSYCTHWFNPPHGSNLTKNAVGYNLLDAQKKKKNQEREASGKACHGAFEYA